MKRRRLPPRHGPVRSFFGRRHVAISGAPERLPSTVQTQSYLYPNLRDFFNRRSETRNTLVDRVDRLIVAFEQPSDRPADGQNVFDGPLEDPCISTKSSSYSVKQSTAPSTPSKAAIDAEL
jgi:hypothetical protein